jgi:DNA invertase Pin-like site-specific DNA recombinase
MTEIALYTRVSTTKQDEDHQVEALRDHLGEDTFRAARKYSDVGSGTDDSREDFNRLRDDIEAGEVDHVVVYEISRVSRRLATASDFIDLCVDTGTGLETVGDGFPTLSGEDSRMDALIAQMVTWALNFEHEMIRGRVQSGVHNAMEKGKWVGRPPFGFDTDSEGYLQVVPDDYTAMQTAIEMTKDPECNKSENAIARACGVPQSTLNRTLKNDEKLALYADGDTEDNRLAAALND